MSAITLKGNNDDKKTGSVALSTIHSAKGLEWKKVFLVDIYDGSFPNTHLMETPLGIQDGNKALEEERRLFYVAITRAKDFLFINYPKKTTSFSGRSEKTIPSRFMNELLEDNEDKVKLFDFSQ